MKTLADLNIAPATLFGNKDQYRIAKRFVVARGHVGRTDQVVEKTGAGAYQVGQMFGLTLVCTNGPAAGTFAVGRDTDAVSCKTCQRFLAA